jgi:hypothetical protein
MDVPSSSAKSTRPSSTRKIVDADHHGTRGIRFVLLNVDDWNRLTSSTGYKTSYVFRDGAVSLVS